MKILIIEDEILIKKSLQILLEKRGADVISESSGKLAIELIKNNQFDRIICDLMLTDITGFDIIEESKQIYTISEISSKFIIMTAYSSTQVLEKATGYGCKVISKPFKDIHQTIDVFLGVENA